MKITETTPPSPERTFSIEFTEDELRTLYCILGEVSKQKIEKVVDSYPYYHSRPKNIALNIAHDIYFEVGKLFPL